ncbi:unnamed protein product, partial [Sphacelaria rigidula]
MENLFRQENCLFALSTVLPIKVHSESEESLKMKFNVGEVDRAVRAWSILFEKLVYPPLVEQVTMLGSPSEAWKHIVRHYETPAS